MRRMRRLISLSGCPVAALLALTACGGGDTESAVTTSGTATSATIVTETATAAESAPGESTGTDEAGADSAVAACELLADEAIESATGRVPAASEVWTAGVSADEGEFACTWSDAQGESIVSIRVWAPPADVDEQFESLRSGLFYDEDLPSPGVGDESFYLLAGVNELGSVVFTSDGRLHQLTLRNPSDAAATAEQEEQARGTLASLAAEAV